MKKYTFLFAAAVTLISCGGGSSGSGGDNPSGSPGSRDSLSALVQTVVARSPEDTEPQAIDSVAETSPDDTMPMPLI